MFDLFTWTKPKLVIPVHGEPQHLNANAAIAKHAEVPHQLVGRNGDKFDLLNATMQLNAVPTGVLEVDSMGRVVPVKEVVPANETVIAT